MSTIDSIVEELKTLPPDRLQTAADYIHRLHTGSRLERKAALRRTAGSLTDEEADELFRIIDKSCERVDKRD